MSYEIILNELILNLTNPLKSQKELELILKARLTKKEFKLLKLLASNFKEEDIKKKLNFNQEEFNRVSNNLIKKLNQEKVKQDLYKRA